jgi:ADP-heptose:LPS heptosyltransferase
MERYPAYVDGFRTFPGFPGLPEQPLQPKRTVCFFREIQAESFDLAIQMHGSGQCSNAVIGLCGAKRCAGFFIPGAFCPDPELFYPYPDHGLEIRRLLALVQFLGFEPDGEDLEFPLHQQDYDSLHHTSNSVRLEPGDYVCIHPGASTAERRWPARGFAVVARTLARLGFRIVLTGSAEEADLTRQVAERLGGACLDLAGRTGLGALAALLDGARLLVCNDTGVSHLAAARRTPSVVISTGNNPERWAPADSRRHRVLCDPAGVSPGDVIAAADALLAQRVGNAPMESMACGPCAS